MLSKSALPLSRALPAVTRLAIMRAASYPPRRNFHISPYSHQLQSRATEHAAASDQSSSIAIPQSPRNAIPPSPSIAASQANKPAGDAVTARNEETHMEDVQEKRDFFWSHPVYHKEQYEKIRVSLTSYGFLIARLGIMKPVLSANMLPSDPLNSSAPCLIW
jgi:hypothetical protein